MIRAYNINKKKNTLKQWCSTILNTTLKIYMSPWYSWNIAESGVKHNKSNQSKLYM
jgi:hypothetical protein